MPMVVLELKEQGAPEAAAAVRTLGEALNQFGAAVVASAGQTTVLQQAVAQAEDAMARLAPTTQAEAANLQVLQQNVATIKGSLGDATASVTSMAAASTQSAAASQAASQAAQAQAHSTHELGGAFHEGWEEALKFGLAITGLQEGIHLAEQAFEFVKEAVLAYDTALVHIATILPEQVDLQGRMRDVLLSIPPIYGDLKTEGAALFTILSANIRDTTTATELLTHANELAFAGFGSVNTAVQLLLRTQTVFGEGLGDLTRANDVFVTSVQTGATSMDTFAHSIERLALPAREAGVSFLDMNAAWVVLNRQLQDGGQTTQILSQFFRALIRDTGEFAAVGIDVARALGPGGGGLASVLEQLQQLTGGNAQALRELLPGLRGLEGITYLVRDGWKALQAQEAQYRDSTGATARSLEERKKGLEEAYTGILNTIKRFAGQVGLELLVPHEVVQSHEAYHAAAQHSAESTHGVAEAAHATQEAMQAQVPALETVAQRMNTLQTAARGLAVDLQKLSSGEVLPKGQLEAYITGLITNLHTLATSTDLTFQQIIAAATRTVSAVEGAFGTLPDQVKGELLQVVENAALEFQSLIAQGQLSKDEILHQWAGLAHLIGQAGFQDLPEVVQPLLDRVRQIAAETGQALPTVFVDGFGKIRVAAEQTALQLDQNAVKIAQAQEQAASAAVRGAQATVQAAQDTTHANVVATQAALEAARQADLAAQAHVLAAQRVILVEQARLLALDKTITEDKRAAEQAVNGAALQANAAQQEALAVGQAALAHTQAAQATERAAQHNLALVASAQQIAQAEVQSAQSRVQAAESVLRAAEAAGKGVQTAAVTAAQADLEAARQAQYAAQQADLRAKQVELASAGIALAARTTGDAEEREAAIAVNAAQQAANAAQQRAGQVEEAARRETKATEEVGQAAQTTAAPVEALHKQFAAVTVAWGTTADELTKQMTLWQNWNGILHGSILVVDELTGRVRGTRTTLAALATGFDLTNTATQFVTEQTKAYYQAVDILAAKLLALRASEQESTALLTTAYSILGAQSSAAMQRMADAAIAAFQIAQRSGTSTAQHLDEIFVHNVLPKIRAAYGDMADKIIADNHLIVSTVMADLELLGAKTNAELKKTADDMQAAYNRLLGAGAIAGKNAADILNNTVLPAMEAAGEVATKTAQEVGDATTTTISAVSTLAEAAAGAVTAFAGAAGQQVKSLGIEAQAVFQGIMDNPLYTAAFMEDPNRPRRFFPGGGGDTGGGAGGGVYRPPTGVTTRGYQSGTDYVPETAWYLLHQGERVVPTAQNAAGGAGVPAGPRGVPGQDRAGDLHVHLGGVTLNLTGLDPRALDTDATVRALEGAIRKAIRSDAWTVELKRALNL